MLKIATTVLADKPKSREFFNHLNNSCTEEDLYSVVRGVSLRFQKGFICKRKHYVLAVLSVHFIWDLNMIF
jgi:hypothetical protein